MEQKHILLEDILVDTRQRKEFNPAAMEELKNDIAVNGLLHAVVVNFTPVKSVDGDYKLIAGERRLRCVNALCNEGVRIRYGDQVIALGRIPVNAYVNLTPTQEQEIELSENIKRRDLTWQELAAATATLHKLRKADEPEQTYQETAKEIKIARGDTSPVTGHERSAVRESEILMGFEEDAEVMGAKDKATAMKIAKRKTEIMFNAALDRESMFDLDGVFDEAEGLSVRHKLYPCSMELAEDHIKEASVDLFIFDPPYGIGVDGFGGAQHLKHDYDEKLADHLYHTSIQLATTLGKEACHMYIFCDFENFSNIKNMCEFFDWSVHRTPIIWDKGPRGHLTSGGTLGWRRSSEYIVFATRGGKQNTGLLSDIIRVVDGSEKFHAAQKPVELYTTLIRHSADPGAVICDFFAGSGPIFDAAEETEATAYGFEIHPEAIGFIGSRRGIYPEEV